MLLSDSGNCKRLTRVWNLKNLCIVQTNMKCVLYLVGLVPVDHHLRKGRPQPGRLSSRYRPANKHKEIQEPIRLQRNHQRHNIHMYTVECTVFLLCSTEIISSSGRMPSNGQSNGDNVPSSEQSNRDAVSPREQRNRDAVSSLEQSKRVAFFSAMFLV
jgi:hypothetical protein